MSLGLFVCCLGNDIGSIGGCCLCAVYAYVVSSDSVDIVRRGSILPLRVATRRPRARLLSLAIYLAGRFTSYLMNVGVGWGLLVLPRRVGVRVGCLATRL